MRRDRGTQRRDHRRDQRRDGWSSDDRSCRRLPRHRLRSGALRERDLAQHDLACALLRGGALRRIPRWRCRDRCRCRCGSRGGGRARRCRHVLDGNSPLRRRLCGEGSGGRGADRRRSARDVRLRGPNLGGCTRNGPLPGRHCWRRHRYRGLRRPGLSRCAWHQGLRRSGLSRRAGHRGLRRSGLSRRAGYRVGRGADLWGRGLDWRLDGPGLRCRAHLHGWNQRRCAWRRGLRRSGLGR